MQLFSAFQLDVITAKFPLHNGKRFIALPAFLLTRLREVVRLPALTAVTARRRREKRQ